MAHDTEPYIGKDISAIKCVTIRPRRYLDILFTTKCLPLNHDHNIENGYHMQRHASLCLQVLHSPKIRREDLLSLEIRIPPTTAFLASIRRYHGTTTGVHPRTRT
jgi:hypothetical protein